MQGDVETQQVVCNCLAERNEIRGNKSFVKLNIWSKSMNSSSCNKTHVFRFVFWWRRACQRWTIGFHSHSAIAIRFLSNLILSGHGNVPAGHEFQGSCFMEKVALVVLLTTSKTNCLKNIWHKMSWNSFHELCIWKGYRVTWSGNFPALQV